MDLVIYLQEGDSDKDFDKSIYHISWKYFSIYLLNPFCGCAVFHYNKRVVCDSIIIWRTLVFHRCSISDKHIVVRGISENDGEKKVKK